MTRSGHIAFFPPNLLCTTAPCFDVIGGVAVRASIRLVAVALALSGAVAGSVAAAAAQPFPPPPPPADYYPPPPQPYAGAPLPQDEGGQATIAPGEPYDDGPPVYRNATGAPPPYGPDYVRPPGPASTSAVLPPGRPYFVPRDTAPPQPAPGFGGEPILRPPGDIAGGSPPVDATGAIRSPAATGSGQERGTVVAALPPEDRPEQGPVKELPPQFRRQLVDYNTSEPAGTIIIDTPHTFLYLVLGRGKALRYGVGVGREGFTWAGAERVSRMTEWPDWHPPKEMIERQPYLPRFMAGGDGNPLGARALYLGNTVYRIHGTNQPSTIGSFVSSGCIRLTNDDVSDLYSRVNVGTRVVVLPGSAPATASAQGRPIH
jgi:lipoprotein-anchoring transpeptidase ErfK/SrfK